MDAIRLQGVMEQARLSMAGLDGVIATISANTLRLVAYLDPQLPMETSSWFAVKDPALTAERWLALYPSSASSEKAEGHDEPRKPTITITQNKIGGFEPRWASFRGFSVLFDNPGVPISHADGLFRIMCSPEAAGELDLYFKLAKTIDEIGRDSLFATYLFCPLPSSSYHVTVWDGINVDNESKLLASLHVEWSHFLRGLPNTLQDPPKTMSIVGESSLLNGAFGDISFRFDKLTIWGKQVLVARLAPAGEPSAQRFSEVSEARALLGRRAKSDLGIDTTETYSPHVTLGYFANLDHGELAQSQMSEWTAHFRKNLEDSVLTLSSMAVYGFTDMTNFYRM
jgi:hypothetical protein